MVCIPNYPTNAPTFIDSALAGVTNKSGYFRSFTASLVPAAALPAGAGTSSAATYAYGASPANQGQTGVRGFGGDHSGIICTTQSGTIPVVNGAVDTQGGCMVLQ